MGSDVGQIFPTAILHRDHSILYALVCEKKLSHMGKNKGNPDMMCNKYLPTITDRFIHQVKPPAVFTSISKELNIY